MTRKTETQLKERQSAESLTQVNLWKDYRAYEHLGVDYARQWVEFWQRQVKHFEEEENHCVRQAKQVEKDSTRQMLNGSAYRCHSWAEDIQKHVEEARKQVRPAEARLTWIEQQLSTFLAECGVSTMEVFTSDHLQDQVMPRKRASSSGQATLKNLRFDRSSRPILRGKIYTPTSSDRRETKLKASSALDPVRSAVFKKPSTKSRSVRPSNQGTQQSQSQSAEHTIVASNSNARKRRRSKRLLTLQTKTSWRDEESTPLRPFRPLKVIKGTVSAAINAKRHSAGRQKTMQQSAFVATKTRSGRQAKKPERLGFGPSR